MKCQDATSVGELNTTEEMLHESLQRSTSIYGQVVGPFQGARVLRKHLKP